MFQRLLTVQQVFDSQCPGTVLPEASTYIVDWVLRPSAKLSPSTDATHEPHNGSYILPSICEGTNGHVDLELTGKLSRCHLQGFSTYQLTGRPPFQIMYNIAQDNENGGTKIMGQPTFNSIQPRTRFQLHTSRPGRMYYEVKQIGDASYPLSENKDTVIPRSERLLFEQQVSIRPSAYFKSRGRLQYCLNDPLVALDSSSQDGLVGLEGSPPFSLVLSIKNIAASQVDKRMIQVPTNNWRLDLPSYIFTAIGPHLVSIETVTDSSGCEQAALDPLHRSIWVDVAETAAIIPIEKGEDICVGDVTQFQLEGIPSVDNHVGVCPEVKKHVYLLI
jgi:nucleoporin POM152